MSEHLVAGKTPASPPYRPPSAYGHGLAAPGQYWSLAAVIWDYAATFPPRSPGRDIWCDLMAAANNIARDAEEYIRIQPRSAAGYATVHLMLFDAWTFQDGLPFLANWHLVSDAARTVTAHGHPLSNDILSFLNTGAE